MSSRRTPEERLRTQVKKEMREQREYDKRQNRHEVESIFAQEQYNSGLNRLPGLTVIGGLNNSVSVSGYPIAILPSRTNINYIGSNGLVVLSDGSVVLPNGIMVNNGYNGFNQTSEINIHFGPSGW